MVADWVGFTIQGAAVRAEPTLGGSHGLRQFAAVSRFLLITLSGLD